ncbi:MAG: MBL fold metallo-hydrolase, partial [Leeuwenhoekiella sp.]
MIFFLVLALLVLFGIAFMMQPIFGKNPTGNHLRSLSKSINYKNSAFQNLSHTPALTEGVKYTEVLKRFLFEKNDRKEPKNRIPSEKNNLYLIPATDDILVWFGHSSYFMQLDGIKILVDPIFSGSASPVPFMIKSFEGSDIYSAADIPQIDYLFLSHDHWDHLDYKTLMALKPKINKIICGLGVRSHLIYWGFKKELIEEMDWNSTLPLAENSKVHSVTARHFSGRRFKRNGTLWTSFILKTPTYNLFLGGDSGYDEHFIKIGEQFGPFDLAILENGQYDTQWKYIHMQPEEVLQAARDLRATRLLPVHSAKFALANHDWDEPLNRITQLH